MNYAFSLLCNLYSTFLLVGISRVTHNEKSRERKQHKTVNHPVFAADCRFNQIIIRWRAKISASILLIFLKAAELIF